MLVVVTMHLRWLLLLMVHLVAMQLSWGVVLKLLVGVYVWCIGVCQVRGIDGIVTRRVVTCGDVM